MTSKKTRIMLWSAITVVVAVIAVLGVTLFQRLQPQKASEVIADVEWYSLEEKEFVITTAEEFADISKLSQFFDFSGQTIKLGADIVFNEGDADDWGENAPAVKSRSIRNFKGTFDGQGHTISGYYSKGYDGNAGLFTNTDRLAVIQDFKIVNSYIEAIGTSGLGSVASGMNVGGTFRRIYSDAILVTDGDNVGGIVGEIRFDTTIEECWYDGEINSSGWCLGGIVGEARRSRQIYIKHCLMTGEIKSTYEGPNKYEASRVGGIIGYLRQTGRPTAIFDDCFVDAKLSAKIEKQMGSVAALLDINTDTVFSNMYATRRTSETTYYAATSGNLTVTGTVLAYGDDRLIGEKAYQWTTLDFDNYWSAVEGQTPRLKCFTENEMELSNVKRVFDMSWYKENEKEFILTTNEQLYGFSLMSSVQNNTFTGKTIKVGADLKLNDGKASDWYTKAPEIEWLSITGFQGIFDGQGHTISGLYLDEILAKQGMFGVTQKGAVIKNFRLVNSFIRVTNSSLGSNAVSLGSIVGTMEDATLENIFSDAIVINSGASGIATGGLVGNVSLSEKNSITNCWFAGYVETNWRTVGGIIGYVSNGQLDIKHCLMSGTVHKKDNNTATRAGAFIGEVMGWSQTTIVNIEDSLVSGIVTSDNPNQSGAVLGFMDTNKNKDIPTSVLGKNVYTIKESHRRPVGTAANKTVYGVNAVVMDRDEWIGYDGYIKTTLDFDNYWAVDPNGTPILKTFAKKVPSLKNVQRWDTSWYDDSKKEFVIKDKGDLCGLTLLVAAGKTMEGKTVKLANDIVVNSGNAADWATNPPAENWLAINGFAGTFDGQGHTISGIYLKRESSKQGLFGSITKTATVKNFKLTNSYFEVNAKDIAVNGAIAAGSIVGSAAGIVEDIYSDAIVVNTTANGEAGTGGIIGYGCDVKIIGCWFDGSVTSDWRGNAGIVGYVSNGTALIKNCLNSGTIHQTIKSQPSRTAGIIGEVLEWSVETVVTIEDCLSVGKITHVNPNQAGGILGYTSGNASKKAYPEVIGSNVYLTREAHKTPTTVSVALNTIVFNEKDIKGYDGYIKTALDFDKYWAVNPEGTPILKKFASTVPSLAGIERYDISWYDESKEFFVINSADKLNGFSLLSAMGHSFKGKTVVLANDIELNSGDAANWSTTAPKNIWMPIVEFAGKFDGQGHTVSGIYVSGVGSKQGFFGSTTKDAVIENFRIENSYFTTDASGIGSSDSCGLGSVVGTAYGIVRNIYSNAIIEYKTEKGEGGIGGIVGSSGGDGVKISNCWFDGTLTHGWKGAAGILGYAVNCEVEIKHCLNTGSINQTLASQPSRTAGIFGYALEWSVETIITIEDCLSVGKITTVNPYQKGSIAGFVHGNTSKGYMASIVGKNVYASTESCSSASGTTVDLVVTRLNAATMEGFGGYKWTELDFAKYWAVDMSGTPVLQTFATEKPDVANIVKPNTEWYDDTKTTYVLKTAADMEGLSYLASKGNTFTGKVFELGADIVLNPNAPATLSGWKTYIENNSLNIWVPIGTSAKPFQGTFDGKGHTISGMYVNGLSDYQGLFAITNSATIKNFKLVDSFVHAENTLIGGVSGRSLRSTLSDIYTNVIIESTYVNADNVRAGGIVGMIDSGNSFVTGCWFDGQIYAAGGSIGGLAGRINSESSANVTISNFLNTGHLESSYNKDPYLGGVIGWRQNGSTVTIKDTVSAGTYKVATGGSVGTIIGLRHWTGSVTCTNVYAVKNAATVANAATTLNPGGTGDAKFTAGAVDVSDKDVTGINAINHLELDYSAGWAVRSDEIPAPKNLVAKEDILLDIGWYDETKDKYTISTAEELFGLAVLSNSNNFAGKTIELAEDIVYNGNTPATRAEWETFLVGKELKEWVSIGSNSKPFAGTFDGKGHSISGLYINAENKEYLGLFSVVEGATVKNVKIVNSYIKSNYPNVGSLAGRVRKSSISGVYSNAVLVNTRNADNARVGGLIGMLDTGKTTINNCQFAGSLFATGGSIGGLLGKIDAISSPTLEVSNFLYTGHLETTWNGDPYLGGVIGWRQNTTTVKILDTVSAGTYKVAVGGSVGTVIGLRHWTGTVTCTDVYVAKNAGIVAGATTTLNPGGTGQANFTAGATDLTGQSFDSMKLDYDTYWTKIAGSHPILTSFASPRIESRMLRKALTSRSASVNADMLDVKVQVATDNSKIMRFISTVDHLDYYKVGFEVTPDGGETMTYETKTVFERIASKEASVEYTFSPKVVDTVSEYFVTAKLNATDNVNYTVRAFVITFDNEKVYGDSRYISLADGKIDTPLNVSFTSSDASIKVGDTLNATYAGKTATATVVAADGANVTVRVNVNKANLDSATKFTFGTAGSTIYRNLYTSYADGADTTWYDVYKAEGETSFVIATDADLYGLSSLNANTFAGETIYLISDITANSNIPATNTAAAWATHLASNTLTAWNGVTTFSGVFDGQGHTVRGIYAKSASGIQFQGLFLKLSGATVQNLRLENSYLENAFRNIGSIAGEMQNSTLSNVYSAAVVKSTSTDSFARVGGLVGQAYTNTNTISKCEFAGEVHNTGGKTGGIISQSGNNTTVEDCIVTGVVKSTFKGRNAETGGICGYVANSGTTNIRGCVFKGNMDTAGGFVGGILGRVEKCAVVIENCLSAGTLINTYVDTGSCFVAGILGGGSNQATDNWTIRNCIVGGTYQITQKALNGIVVGHRRWSGSTRVASNVYVLNSGITAGDGGTLAMDGGGTNSGVGYVDVTGKSVNGYGALTNAPNLDYTTKWTLMDGTVPMPSGVAKTGALITPDVVWTKNADNKYEITSIEELTGLACVVNGVSVSNATLSKKDALTASYVLTKDITLNEGDASIWKAEAPLYKWIPIGNNTNDGFQGTFDGQGYTISGVYLNAEVSTQGLFGTITNAATVQDFSLKNSCFLTTKGTLGSIAGICYGTVSDVYTNAYVESTVTGEYARVSGMFGILGGYQTASVSRCQFDGTVKTAGDMTGGIAGQVGASPVTITDCLSTGTIISTFDAAPKAGGIFGWIQNHAKVDLSMENCYSDCTMSVMRNYQVGKVIGMIGNSSAWLGKVTVSNVYASNFVIDVKGTAETLGGASSAANIQSGTIKVLSVEEVEAKSGFDFTNVWKMQDGNVALKNF